MDENAYIQDIISGLGLALNEKNNSEIIINYPIKYDKKSMQFMMNTDYQITMQKLGSFLADFLNTDFDIFENFFELFIKYSLTFFDLKKIQKIFDKNICSELNFREFLEKLLEKNKNEYKKLQEQTDMILDYCLLNPNKKAISFKPIERLYVLRRIASNLTLLNENKASYYSVNLFSSYPGKSEKEIYDFLSQKKNRVTEYDLILPYNLSAIIYKSICSILKGNVYLKSCKNCNRYFIATNKSYNYCENIAPGEKKKTCREIGRRLVFENNKNNDPILASYYQLYNRKAMMKSRNSDIVKYITDFDKFKETGKKKVAQYKNGKLSPDDFKRWIEKNG